MFWLGFGVWGGGKGSDFSTSSAIIWNPAQLIENPRNNLESGAIIR
jgi:hypothetical protein